MYSRYWVRLFMIRFGIRLWLYIQRFDFPYIGDLTLWANYQNIIKSNALLHKPQLFIGSLERYYRAESETSRTFEKKLFGEFMRERNTWPLRTQYIFTWKYVQMYVHIASSKVVRTCHQIRRPLRRSLVLKIHPNPYQMPGTTAEKRKKNMDKYEGAPF